ncbi:MAG: hypothetical protein LC130_22030 [Bryobacterales bacterium]|nr:hypothetical protein [Bryobacterales bacterium]MEB2362486.1 hypothetical protein [Bryobacterales bacterium]
MRLKRRQFVPLLGASAFVGSPAAAQSGLQRTTRSRVELNGAWERYVDSKLIDVVQVPSSLRLSGYYQLRRQFILPRLNANERAFLCFDGIALHASAAVSGRALGDLDPYVPYEFDITPHVREGANAVEVSIADLTPGPSGAGADAIEIGINPGWEAYGGIIRDAYVELRPSASIENVRFSYTLEPGFNRAQCTATVFASSSGRGEASIDAALYFGGNRIAGATTKAALQAGPGQTELTFQVDHPALWSPERSNLYELRIVLKSSAGQDTWSQRTGFRQFAIRGRALELNGERLILNGLNRHDMWKDQGFTLSRAQMEKDMRLIKAMGANYVRLVHYPHHRYVVELADEIGLAVSEEPGYWQVDFGSMPRSRVNLGLRIMERTIRRDWNSPSVLFWILGNESRLTVEYLREGRELCKHLDPVDRPVSFANSMDPKAAKPIMEAAGLDIYTQHPYTYDLRYFESTADHYGPEKPLVFTEWGGKAIGQTEIIMESTVNKLLELVNNGKLAGHAFWSWQDVPEFSRIDPEMRDGILESGVVTEAREPRRIVYSELSRLFQGRLPEQPPFPEEPERVILRRVPWDANSRCEIVDLQPVVNGDRGQAGWTGFLQVLEQHWTNSKAWFISGHWDRMGRSFRLWRRPDINISGVEFRCPTIANEGIRPVVLGAGMPESTIPVGKRTRRIHILGHVTLPNGFPVTGVPGEIVARYRIVYGDGDRKEIPLRQGFEVARANTIHVATRINPIAMAAPRALTLVRDSAREVFQFLLYSIDTGGREVTNLTCIHEAGKPPLLLLAVTAELA